MAILEKVDKLHHAIAWRGDMPITSRYTAGIAGERFFREIKDNARFLGTRCETCDLIYVPATMFCERCFAELDEWVEVPSRGTVFTYTVLYRDLDDKPLDPPADPGLRQAGRLQWRAGALSGCGRPGCGLHRHGGGGGVQGRRRARGLDPGHPVLPAGGGLTRRCSHSLCVLAKEASRDGVRTE